MRNLLKGLLALLAVFAMLPAMPALAQHAPDPVGEWSGVLATPQGELTLILYIARGEDGDLSAELESPNQAPGQKIPATEITLEDGKLVWRIARINASYEGQWNAAEEQWQGVFNQGFEMELNLARGLPEANPVVEGLDGTWRGAVETNGVTLRLVLNVTTGDRGTAATLDSPDQLARGLPIDNLTRNGQQVSFEFTRGRQRFDGALSEDGSALSGAWSGPNMNGTPITLVRDAAGAVAKAPNRPQTPQEPLSYSVEEVDFDNPDFEDVHLAGSLTLPEGEGPFPAAVLITGSGAQDRDETLLGHKPFAVIADHLTRHGIAVLRYDDRGVGGSTGNYAAATSADLATDANAAARFLMTRDDIDHQAVGFIGHSEGGMIAPIAMAENDDIAYFVSLAGPGTKLDQLLLSQRRLTGAQMGMSEEVLDRAEPVMVALFDAIGDATSHEEGLEAARAVLTPEAMVAIGAPPETPPQVVRAQIGTPWFYYFLSYDPAPNLSRISVPILALNGSLDRQVPSVDNLAAIAEATSGNADVTTMELEGLNHLFQTARTGAVGEYADIEETFSPAALTIVSDWIAERFLEQ